MTVTLKPDLEEELAARAKAEGLTTEECVNRYLEKLIATEKQVETAKSNDTELRHRTPEEWEQALNDFIQHFPPHPVLSVEAISRESIYSREGEM